MINGTYDSLSENKSPIESSKSTNRWILQSNETAYFDIEFFSKDVGVFNCNLGLKFLEQYENFYLHAMELR